MDFNHFGQNKKKKSAVKAVSNDNFIEALKGIGGGVAQGVKRDVVGGVAQNAFDTIMGKGQSGMANEAQSQVAEMNRLQEQQTEQAAQAEHRRLHIMRQKEEVVFSARQVEIEKEITSLQEELKKLAVEMGAVAREVQIAAVQETVDPGTYHVSFFEHLRRVIKIIRQKLSDSASWLNAATNRAEQKKKGYWGKVKSQGTKFMLSDERKMATQTG